jgi:hypothetical protein
MPAPGAKLIEATEALVKAMKNCETATKALALAVKNHMAAEKAGVSRTPKGRRKIRAKQQKTMDAKKGVGKP